MTTTPDPTTVHEIAVRAICTTVHQTRDAAVSAAIFDHDAADLGEATFKVHRTAVLAEYDRLAAALSWPYEQQQNERDATVPDDLWWPFTGGMDTCFSEHDGEYRECCWRAGLAYMLPLHEQQVRAKVAAERDGDVRAVAEVVLRLKSWLTGRQANIHPKISTTSVIAEPRDRSTAAWAIAESDVRAVVAALDARDAKAGEQR